MSQTQPHPNEIFISYSRKNADFVERLAAQIKAREIDPWIDLDDIPKGREWWQEIQTGISNANAFLFIVSVDSLQSMICNWEVAYALKLAKKIIPVLHEDVFDNRVFLSALSDHQWSNLDDELISAGDNWKRLSSLNFVRHTDHNDLLRTTSEIVESVRTDYDYLNEHTRLGQRALEWDSHERHRSFLLTGLEIRSAQQWLTDATEKQPGYTRLQLLYIQASAQNQRRNQRTIFSGVLIALSISIILTILSLLLYQDANQQREVAGNNLVTATIAQGEAEFSEGTAVAALATAERRAAESDSIRLANLAEQAYAENDIFTALSLALHSTSLERPPRQSQEVLAKTAYFAPRLRLTGHSGQINAIAFHPDGHEAASSGRGEIIIWDLNRGEVRAKLDGQSSPTVYGYMPDGESLLLSLTNNVVVLWDRYLTKQVKEYVIDEPYWYTEAAAISPDGRFIAVGSRDGLIIFDQRTGERVFERGIQVQQLAFLPDSTGLVTGGSYQNGQLSVWDMATGQFRNGFFVHQGGVNGLVITPDGRYAITSNGLDEEIEMWDLTTGKSEIGFMDYAFASANLAISPDGHWVLSHTGGFRDPLLVLWNMESVNRDAERTMIGHHYGITGLAFSPDSQHFLTADGGIMTTNADGYVGSTLLLWDIHNGAELETIKPVEPYIYRNEVARDGGEILASTWTQVFKIDGSGYNIRELPGLGDGIFGLELSPDKNALLIGGCKSMPDKTPGGYCYEGEGKLVDYTSGEVIAHLEGFNLEASGVSFDALSSRAAIGGGGRVVVLDTSSGNVLFEDIDVGLIVYATALSPNGRMLVAAGCAELGYLADGSHCVDGGMVAWDLETGQRLPAPLAETNPINAVRFAPDGTLVAGGCGFPDRVRCMREEITHWDVRTGALLRRFRGVAGSINVLDIDPTGSLLLTGGQDARVWDLKTGEQIAFFPSLNLVSNVRFLDNGNIAAVSSGGILRFWRIDTVEELAAWVTDNRAIVPLDCQQRETYVVEPFCDENGRLPSDATAQNNRFEAAP